VAPIWPERPRKEEHRDATLSLGELMCAQYYRYLEDVREGHMGQITLRYWAGARGAAGVEFDQMETEGPLPISAVAAWAVAQHPALAKIMPVCRVLFGNETYLHEDAMTVVAEPGTRVEFLPPFAGG
jgi:molybdopterin converting factor small subunit